MIDIQYFYTLSVESMVSNCQVYGKFEHIL